MIRSLLVPDYVLERMNPMWAILLIVAFGTMGRSNLKGLPVGILMSIWCTRINWGDLELTKGWKPLLGEQEIHKMLLRRNEFQLSQSGDTPFAEGEIAVDIGKDGTEEAVEYLLEGSYDWGQREGISLAESKELKTFLDKLKRPEPDK